MPAPKGNKFAKGNKGGRPTKYDPKYCGELVSYFSKPAYKEDTETKKLVANELPTIEKFCKRIGISTKTLLNWVEQNEEFLLAYREAKGLYKNFLIENGLLGLYNPTFAIFVAKSTTDLRDTQHIDLTSKGERIGLSDEEKAKLDKFFVEDDNQGAAQ